MGSSRAKTANLMVRLDASSKELVRQVAILKGVSTSDYVRSVVVTTALRERGELERSTIALSPADQLAFWRALNEPAKLTPAQRRLSIVMRGRR